MLFAERRENLWSFSLFSESVRPAVVAALAKIPRMSAKGVDGFADTFGGRRVFLLRPEVLLATQQTHREDAAAAAAYHNLIEKAELALTTGPYSVAHKTGIPPSGDKRDYMSLPTYWWPDPEKPNGLPYKRRDGKINPERHSDVYDSSRLQSLSRDTARLSLAYFYTGDLRYAQRVALLLRTWFLEPATRMNPHLDFTQTAPGSATARHNGVIDTIYLMPVVESLGLILPANVLTDQEVRDIEAWFSTYVDWMIGSTLGMSESRSGNNHGLWYDAQLCLFGLFARRPEVTRGVAEAFPRKRIAPQFAPDGTFPAEIPRTKTLHYFVYSLSASYDVAATGECLGIDLWNYASETGAGLKTATDFLAPYGGPNVANWPYPDAGSEPTKLTDLLLRAHLQWSNGNYLRSFAAPPNNGRAKTPPSADVASPQ